MAFEAKANSNNTPRWARYINPVNWVKGIIWFFVRCARFIRDSFKEAKRITWPSRDKVTRSTLVVIVSVVAITVLIWAVDSIFSKALDSFLKLLG